MNVIPVLDVGRDEEPGLVTVEAEPERLAILLKSAARTYTPLGVLMADSLSRRLARETTDPYAPAVKRIAARMGRPGGFLLNYSYEWGCTAGVIADTRHGGMTLLRTLDWPFDGLGRALVVTRWDGSAGSYLSVTWPGLVGVLTGLARGRFAAAINQPPLPLPQWGKILGWLAARMRVGCSAALPPSHLLRLAFDTCPSFDAALALLRQTPICIPAIFTIAGARAGEWAVIERRESEAFDAIAPAAANHWTAFPKTAGRPRNGSSIDRHGAMGDTKPIDSD